MFLSQCVVGMIIVRKEFFTLLPMGETFFRSTSDIFLYSLQFRLRNLNFCHIIPDRASYDKLMKNEFMSFFCLVMFFCCSRLIKSNKTKIINIFSDFFLFIYIYIRGVIKRTSFCINEMDNN